MPDTPPTERGPRESAAAPERRRHYALRELIDEMLVSIRTAVHRELWTPEERAQYERELAEIMVRVRGEALARTAAAGRDRSDPPAA